ncbi:MAG: DMT family transporter [Pseudomonadota bacterium]
MSVQKSLSPQALGELLLLSLIWGASFLAIRIALDEITPLTVVAHRCGWAMLLLWTYVLLRRFPIPLDLKTWAAFLGMGLLNNVIPFGLIAWGQLYVETGLAAIFNASTAIFGVLVAALVFADEKLTRRKIIGVALGFSGVVLAIGPEALKGFNITSLGQLAIVAATFSYACAGAWARKFMSHVRPEVAAAGMLTGASIVAIPLAWWVDGPISLNLIPETWAAIAYYAVFATAGAYLLYYRVLAMAGSGNLMLCTLLLVPVAIVLGAIVRAEALPASAYGGFALLALGLLILTGRLLRRL